MKILKRTKARNPATTEQSLFPFETHVEGNLDFSTFIVTCAKLQEAINRERNEIERHNQFPN